MKIKIIDLLNKIANNEEVPEKIMFDEWLYIYNEREKTYYDEEDRKNIMARKRKFSRGAYSK